MATKKNKAVKFNLKRLLADKRVLVVIGLGVALFVVLGLSTFAATNQKLPNYKKSFTTCRTKVLTFGSKERDCMKYVQDRLNYACDNNFFSNQRDLKVDGGFGSITATKISGFQRATNLKSSNGRVDRRTWDKLSYYYGGGTKPRDVLSCR